MVEILKFTLRLQFSVGFCYRIWKIPGTHCLLFILSYHTLQKILPVGDEI